MIALVPEAQLLEQPVVAAHLAVVAGDDDEGRVGQPALPQVLEEGCQAVVHLALGAVVGGADLAALPLVAGGAHPPHAHGHRPERVDRRLLLARRAPDERPDRLGRVQVVVADGVAPRRVGPDERGVDEERRVAVALQPGDELLAQERRLRELDGEARRSPGRPVLVGAGETLDGPVQVVRVGGDVDAMGREPTAPGRAPLLPGILDEGPEARQDALVVRQPRVARRHRARIDRGVGVAEEDRVVSALPRQQRHVREAGVERRAVEDRAVPVLVRARVQAGPRGPARRGVRPVIGEEHAPGGQRVERRRLHHRVAQGREAVAPPLVERDEQHVAWRRHAATLVHRAGPSRDTGGPHARAAANGSGRADRCSSEPGPEVDQPGADAWAHRPAHCSASGHRGSGGRALCRPGVGDLRPRGDGRAGGSLTALIRSWRWASAWECTAFAWIIILLPRWTALRFGLRPLQACSTA